MIDFYHCESCKKIISIIKNGEGKLVCCGKDMNKLEANTSDGAEEKHVPAVERKDGKLYVQIGSVEHPMIEEHHIEWIAVASDKVIERVLLSPGEKPQAVFTDNGKATVYEYCNLHGLWKVEI